jgi:hypothetical protein
MRKYSIEVNGYCFLEQLILHEAKETAEEYDTGNFPTVDLCEKKINGDEMETKIRRPKGSGIWF